MEVGTYMALDATKFYRHKVAGLLRDRQFMLDSGFDCPVYHGCRQSEAHKTSRAKLLPDAVLVEQLDKFIDMKRFQEPGPYTLIL